MEQTFLIWVVIIPDLKRIAFDVVCQRVAVEVTGSKI